MKVLLVAGFGMTFTPWMREGGGDQTT